MKTADNQTKSRLFRYRNVLEGRKKSRENLLKAINYSGGMYYNLLFQTGCSLVADYFGTTNDVVIAREISLMQKYILNNSRSGFWVWFQNKFEQSITLFWNEVRNKFKDDKTFLGEMEAIEILKDHLCDWQAEFIRDNEVHEQLRQFIIQHDEIWQGIEN